MYARGWVGIIAAVSLWVGPTVQERSTSHYERTRLCNQTLTATTTPKILLDPGQVNGCWWKFQTADPGHRLVLDTLALVVDKLTDCEAAKVTVHDGADASAGVMRSWCGGPEKSLLTTNTGSMYMTAEPRYYQIFFFKYYQELVERDVIKLTASTTPVEFESPGYPEFYYNDTDRIYTIRAESPGHGIVLETLDFNLEWRNHSNGQDDSVSVYEGSSTSGRFLGRYYWTLGPALATKLPSITLRFHTYTYRKAFPKYGFRLRYYTVPASHITGEVGSRGIATNTVYRYVQLEDFIDVSYNGQVTARWNFETGLENNNIRLTVFSPDSDMFCSKHVTVHDGPSSDSPVLTAHCSKRGVEFQGTQPNITLYFTSSGDVNITGVKMRYYTTRDHYPCGRTINVTNQSGIFSSLGYPNNYDSNLNCDYILTTYPNSSIRLEVGDIQMDNAIPCFKDSLTVFDGSPEKEREVNKICASQNIQYTTSGNYARLRFSTDREGTARGVRFSYRAVPKTDACLKQNLMATDVKYEITFPGGHAPYDNNQDCQWAITAPGVHAVIIAVNMSLEDTDGCTKDYLEAFDGFNPPGSRSLGRWCGDQNVTAQSSGIFLTLVFHSDNQIRGQGFRVVYSSKLNLNPQLTGGASTVSSMMTILVAVFMMAALVVRDV